MPGASITYDPSSTWETGQVSVTNAATPLLAGAAVNHSGSIEVRVPTGGQTVYFGRDNTVTAGAGAGNGFPVEAGGVYRSGYYTNLWAIVASGTQTVGVDANGNSGTGAL